MTMHAPLHVLVLLLVGVICYTHATPSTYIQTVTYNLGDYPWQHYNQSEYVFQDQLVDHFSLDDPRVFGQRFFVVNQFWQGPTYPVLFIPCGEAECPGVIPVRLFPLELAYELGCLVVVVEHRYYGDSNPTTLDTVNLHLLNSRQAINDFAYFQDWYQRTQINAVYNTSAINRWLVYGGSYAGALSAWYRLKFPHLVVGSVASSAVVEAVMDFPAFDGQVETSAGMQCAAALKQVEHRYDTHRDKSQEQQLTSFPFLSVVWLSLCAAQLTALIEARFPEIKRVFNCAADIHDGDFMFMIADVGAEAIQYGHRHALCDLLDAARDPDALVAAFLNYTRLSTNGGGNPCGGYDRRDWLDLTPGNADRSWGWQTCTEVGFWQIARDPAVSIRSQLISHEYYTQLCKDVFNLTTLPQVNATNNYYGGWNVSTSNTFFINGVEDEWQWAGVRQSLGPTVPAVIVNCDQCAHCVELYTPTDNDAQTLKDTRNQVISFVKHLLFG